MDHIKHQLLKLVSVGAFGFYEVSFLVYIRDLLFYNVVRKALLNYLFEFIDSEKIIEYNAEVIDSLLFRRCQAI